MKKPRGPRGRAIQRKPLTTTARQSPPERFRTPNAAKTGGTRPPGGRPGRANDVARARGRQQAYLQARRQRKRVLVMCSRLRVLVKLCFFLLLCFALWRFAQAPFWVFDAPRLQATHSGLLTLAELGPAARSQVGKPMTQVDPQAIEAWLKRRYPIVDRAIVRRALFPARLTMMIAEKPALAQIYVNPAAPRPAGVLTADYAILPLKPYPQAIQTFPRPDLLRVYANPSQRLPKSQMQRLVEVGHTANRLEGLTFQHIDFRNPQQATLVFSEIKAHLGPLDAGAGRRLARLPALIPVIRQKTPEIDAVNLQWMNQTTFHRANSQWKRDHASLKPTAKGDSMQNPPINPTEQGDWTHE